MRSLKVIALVLAIGLIPLIAGGAFLKQRERDQASLDHQLVNRVSVQATELEAGFARGRTISLLTARNPSFGDFYAAPGTRAHKIAVQGPPIERLNDALAYLEQLYPDSIGEACFIDVAGGENARVVRGVRALPADLSADETKGIFFRSSFAKPVGRVNQSRPYVSPDTGEWVISNATPILGPAGTKIAIVHFELTIDSFRRAAARVGLGGEVVVVDSKTGEVVLNSRHEQPLGSALGRPSDRRFARLPGESGLIDRGGDRIAYRQVGGGTDNDWTIVAVAPRVGAGSIAVLSALPIAAVLLCLIALAIAMGRRWARASGEAETDALTGLGNRRKLEADLAHAIPGATLGQPIAIFVSDLDGFKRYNDTFGHPAGDALLARLGTRLSAAVSGSGTAYRLGGDEFCVVTGAQEQTLGELKAVISDALSDHGEGFTVTTACGSVVAPADGVDRTLLLRLADERLYAAKRNGRFGVGRQTTDVLLKALQERHPTLREHLNDVAELAGAVATRFGLTPDEADWVRQAGALHDLGKMAIPDAILSKPGPLDSDEWTFIRQHTLIGERILIAAPALTDIARLVRSTHERWDGGGYPDGLAGGEIPLGARIVAVCDAFDAMCTERPYRFPVSEQRAVAELRRCAGTQFDPEVVEAFCVVLAESRGVALAVA